MQTSEDTKTRIARVRPPRSHRISLGLALLSIIIVVGLWQLSGNFLQPMFISTPTAVAVDWVKLVAKGTMPLSFLESLGDMAVGLAISISFGVTFGVLMGRYRVAEAIGEPFLNFFIATPTIALLPLMEIWFGFNMEARVSFIIAVCMWSIIVNTLTGIRNVSQGYRDVADAFGLSEWQQMRSVHLQAAMPYILAGMRVALYQSAIGMILSGQEIGVYGLGGLLQTFGQYFQTGRLEATIFTSTILMFLVFAALKRFQSRFYPWIAATSLGQR